MKLELDGDSGVAELMDVDAYEQHVKEAVWYSYQAVKIDSLKLIISFTVNNYCYHILSVIYLCYPCGYSNNMIAVA